MGKRGFTLVELLVVVAILGILMAVLLVPFNTGKKNAEKAKCEELVSEVATVLTKIHDDGAGDREGVWPEVLLDNSNTERGLDEVAGYLLARKGMNLTYNADSRKLVGNDRFGIISPWAEAAVKGRKSGGTSLTTHVPSGGTIESHRLRYALCDNTGKVKGANVGGEAVDIDVKAAVWCAGADGKIEPYSEGIRSDDVYSWDFGKVRNRK